MFKRRDFDIIFLSLFALFFADKRVCQASNTGAESLGEPLGPSSRRGALVFSEIMVHPPAAWAGASSAEFIELYNTGLITEDLTGHQIAGDVAYTFPSGTRLAPGNFLLVAKDPAAAQAHYGVACIGPYTGSLSNSGGRLRLLNELGGTLLEVPFDNRPPWPAAAFGTGHSLVLNRPSYGEGDVRAWSASDQIGGSPGADDAVGFDPIRGILINEFLAHTDLPQVDMIELFNSTAVSVDLSGAWLSDEAGSNKYRIANGTTIPARGHLSFDQAQLGFALSAAGEAIFLVNPSRTRVIDAVSFRGQDNGVSEGRYPDGAPGFQALVSATPGSANARPLVAPVVINEIMYHPISEADDDEYVEFHNRSSVTMDLSGWQVEGGISYQFPEGAEIPGGGFVVVAKNRDHVIAKYTQLDTQNTFGDFDGTLNNRSETIRLSRPDTLLSLNALGREVTNTFYITVDEMTYQDGGRWTKWSDGGGSSLELVDPDADNRLAANWADSDESTKAPWTDINVTERLENGQASIDEGFANGRANQCNRLELFLQGAGEAFVDDVQFINRGQDLVGNGSFASGTSRWTYRGVTRLSSVQNAAGPDNSAAFKLVCESRGDTAVNKVANQLTGIPRIQGADTGTIRAKVRWLKGARQIHLRLRGNWMEVSQNLLVPTNCGTPGQRNSRRLANVGPAIHDVAHSPVLPTPGQDVVVTARVADPDGIALINLRYRLDPAFTYATAAMNDQGFAGDAMAGDGIYSATIPGGASGTLAAFFIIASDGAAAGRFPAAAPREGLVRWGEPQFVGQVGTYRLWMTQNNISYWSNRHPGENDGIDATFVYGNCRVVYNVGTQYSGSPFHSEYYNGPDGSFSCDYEINFEKDDRFLGSEPFVLSADENNNGFWFDESAQVDLTGTWIGRKLGQQYNHRRHVHMVFNGQRRGTIYHDTQQPNSEMLDQYFPDDSQSELRKIEDWFEYSDDLSGRGNLHGRIGRINDHTGAIDTKSYRWNWRPRATDDHNNWFNFTNFVAAVNDSGAANWEKQVRTWMDVPNFVRPMATYRICSCWDSYAYERGKNTYAFKPDDTGWRLLLWDIEFALGNNSRGPTDNIYRTIDPTIFNAITSIPSIHREYLMAFQEAIDGPLAPGVAAAILNERYNNLRASGVSVGSPQFIINFINARRAYLQGVLPSAPFDVYGPNTVSIGDNSLELTGTAPLSVAEIHVNGVAHQVKWISTVTWTITVPLEIGVNNLTVQGVDRHGTPVAAASESLTVTVSGSEPDPEGLVLLNEIAPSAADRELQFLELYNAAGSHRFDLSGWRVNGIGYTFPAGSAIGPGETLLLVADRFRFASRHAGVSIFDVYSGSLDPDGETLTLFRPGPTPDEELVVDRVQYHVTAPWPDASAGGSLQLVDASRDNARAANWVRNNRSSSPGAVNELTMPLPAFPLLWLNEVQAENRSGETDQAGDLDPWLELHNSGTSPLALDGFFLTDHFPSPLKWAFPSGLTLPAGGFLRVWCDDEVSESSADAPHASFVLPASSGQVALTRVVGGQPQFVDFLRYSNLPPNHSYGSIPDAQPFDRFPMFFPTPGANNNGAARPITLRINEWMADNDETIVDPADGKHQDWFELYNPGITPVDLGGFYLTDDLGDPFKFQVPETGDYTIAADGFLLVWADDDPQQNAADRPGLHVNFKLSKDGEGIAVVAADGTVVDSVVFGEQDDDESEGRVPDGFGLQTKLDAPSPGAANSPFRASRELESAVISTGQIRLAWPSMPGMKYRIYYTDDPLGATWTPLGDPIPGTGAMLQTTNSTGSATIRLFRVQQEAGGLR